MTKSTAIQALTTAAATMGMCACLFGMASNPPAQASPTQTSPEQGSSNSTSKTVLDGVYSARQAQRGEDTYLQYCSTCHGANLMGGESEAPLVGNDFLTKWSDKTLGDFFTQIQQTMPKDNPGSLSTRECADVIAYVLSANNYPAGDQALSSSADTLQQIRWAPQP